MLAAMTTGTALAWTLAITSAWLTLACDGNKKGQRTVEETSADEEPTAWGSSSAATRVDLPPEKWKVGHIVDISIPLHRDDRGQLACASSAEIAGKRCEFTSENERYPEPLSDAEQLRPYRTTVNVGLLAAGVWSSPALTKGLPQSRFVLKCQFTIQGKIRAPGIRWSANGKWDDPDETWFAGMVSECVLEK